MTLRKQVKRVFDSCYHLLERGACRSCVATGIRDAVEEEREECAAIVDGIELVQDDPGTTADLIADAIRARGENEP